MITEGLRENDLQNLVLDIISIDEYESKIDESAIVVGLYVFYKDPAYDLNKFIQKTNVDIIDTDISPAPTEDGYYIVFIELERDNDLYKNILNLVNNINNLSGITSWSFKTFGDDDIHPLTFENLQKFVPNNSLDKDEIEESVIYDYLKDSILDDMYIQENEILFIKNGKKLFLEFVDFDVVENTRSRNMLIDETISYDMDDIAISNKINSFIGPNYDVEKIGHYYSIKNSNQELLVRY